MTDLETEEFKLSMWSNKNKKKPMQCKVYSAKGTILIWFKPKQSNAVDSSGHSRKRILNLTFQSTQTDVYK